MRAVSDATANPSGRGETMKRARLPNQIIDQLPFDAFLRDRGDPYPREPLHYGRAPRCASRFTGIGRSSTSGAWYVRLAALTSGAVGSTSISFGPVPRPDLRRFSIACVCSLLLAGCRIEQTPQHYIDR